MLEGSERANWQHVAHTTLYGMGDLTGYIPTCLYSIIHSVVVKKDT